ncbi:MAG: two-component sensor histidine kinase [Phascolarctobacterium sp.]|nr:MAG: two-component sensor histidine kinase [Phascolarctobacterium sp.]
MNKSLSSRLMYSFMALIMVIVVGVTAGISYLIADYFFKSNEQELAEKGNEMAATVEYFMEFDNSRETLRRYVFAVDRLVGARIWLFDDKYELVAASNINTDYKLDGTRPGIKDLTMMEGSAAEISREIKSGKLDAKVNTILKDVYSGKSVQSQIYHPYYKEQVMLVGVPYGKEGSSARGAILLAQPLSGFDGFLRDIYIYTSIVAILALILSMFMVRSLTKTMIKPLVLMKDSAMAIAAGDYTRKVEVHGDDEVADLGRALNALGNDLSEFVAKTERAEKIRRDFVANVSHELRTPLTIIRGYNEAISDGTVTDKDMIQRYRLLINEETMRLERMIRELLDISRMQAAEELPPAKMQPLPLGAIVRNVAEKLMVNAVERNVKLLVHVDEKIQIMGQGDQMVQLVLIIGDNALKYTPANGTVTFLTELLDDGSVRLTISDQGPGIPEEDLPFIWERFYKVDKSHSRNVPGTGLGLAIAREIIRVHGARVQVFSKLGEGTRFEITFPKDKVIAD